MYEYEKPNLNELKDSLMHVGVGHLQGGHSGRYPWGSGKDQWEHSDDYIARINKLRKENFTYYDEETGITYTGDTAIAKSFNLSTTKFRSYLSIAQNEERGLEYNRIKRLKDSGMGASEIARKVYGDPKKESRVRSILDEQSYNRMQEAINTADFLEQQISTKGMIDVGPGVERELNVSRKKLQDAMTILESRGYENLISRVPQPTDPNKQTTINVMAPPGTPKKDAYDFGNIHSVADYITRDEGESYEKKFYYPESLDSSRIKIRYAEDGGAEKDGVIELRRNVQDLSLGNSVYSQVRILVDGNKYLKGMAVYGDDKDFPKGVDVIFNSHHSKDENYDNLKPIKDDPDNPFGSAIKDANQGGQYFYIDSKTGERKLGLINKRADEGDWSEWKDKIPSQFLSKQSLGLAKQQLGLAIKEKKDEYDSIMALDNPTVKKKLLETFANDCDSAAEHLQAAALPRQKYQVLLPINSLPDNKVYAPNFENGEKVALIRYPHGGTFEIPILTVDNNNPDAVRILTKNAKDCVGVNANVASRLSGADFDGDTVMVVPTGKSVNITSTKPLQGLVGFSTDEYGTTHKVEQGTKLQLKAKEMRKKGESDFMIGLALKMDADKVDKLINEGEDCYYSNITGKRVKIMNNTQTQMGEISNLITDMTLKGAPPEDLEKAVRHSMVVIDAEKHKLDYRSSYVENDIKNLKEKYQDGGGASTLISRASAEVQVTKRQGTPKINIKGKKWYDPDKPEGSLIYKRSDNADYLAIKHPVTKKEVTVYERDGKYFYNEEADPDKPKKYVEVKDSSKILNKERTVNSTRMAEHQDARELISKEQTKMELVYADYANTMKAMANQARKELATTPDIKYNAKAAKEYSAEVESLKNQLYSSEKNAPRERQAQLIANSKMKAIKEDNPKIKKDEYKKRAQQELTKAREKVGAKRTTINISDKEWEAIQKGAVSANVLKSILGHTDTDAIKERATPRSRNNLTAGEISRIKQLKNMGYTNEQIAKSMSRSASTIAKYV